MVGKRLSHYIILSQIGTGGMGEVYRAKDENLEREVAIKILPQEVRSDREKLHRFIREAKTASTLKHPNIASIYELGEADGIHFIAMELVDGKTLDAVMKEGALSAPEIAEIGIQISGALQEAHEHGIVHRDIKPANIMVNSRGHIKVLDFGLAKVSQLAFASPSDASAMKTASGTILGTVHYISPEQALGKEIDGRSDLFSLGVVLYQMTTGVLPFDAENMVQMIDSILHADPAPPSSVNPKVPIILERLILRCLEKDKTRRFASASELAQELQLVKGNLETVSMSRQFVRRLTSRRVPEFFFLGLVVTLLIFFGLLHFQPAAEKGTIDSVAILPFSSSTTGPDGEYLSDGITEGIIDRLSELPRLKVLARGTVFTYKGKQLDPRKVGRELEVDAVVTGSVLQRNQNLLIRAELVRTSDGTQLWGQQYNWDAVDLPKVQSEIAGQISDKLRSKLSGEERRKVVKNYTENPEAYQLYLRGRYYWNRRSASGFQKSIECYQHAIALDPNFALAYSGLAETYTLMPAFAVLPPNEGHPKAKAAAKKALELDPDLVEAYTALAHTEHNYDWDWKEAEQNYKHAIRLNPNYAIAHHWYGNLLSEWGRKQEAIEQKREALKLDPLSIIINADYGYILYEARQYDAAIDQLKKTIDLDPNFALAYQDLAFVYLAKRNFPEAISYFQKANEIEPDSLEIRAQLAQAYAMSGQQHEARKLLTDLLDLSSTQYVASFDIAMIYAGLGETAKAFEWLEKAFDERSYQLTGIKVEPRLDMLRNEPRFQEMIHLLNIPEQ